MTYIRYKTIRSTKGNSYIYLMEVQNRWISGVGPRQKVIKYIGRAKTNTLTKDIIKEVYQRDSYKCIDCASETNLTIDHIISPLDGGSNYPDNLRIRCLKCNQKRGRVKPISQNNNI